MSSIITLMIIIFALMTARKGRSDRIGRTGRAGSGEPAFKPDRRLSRQVEELKKNERQAQPAGANEAGNSGWESGFAESYREDPAKTAGMKGRTSAVPASGRSAILEADDELNEMIAGKRIRHTSGKDTTESISMLDAIFSGSGNSTSQAFAGFEDRSNDWLARQLRGEQHIKKRIMSDMMSLKLEHEEEHQKLSGPGGRRRSG